MNNETRSLSVKPASQVSGPAFPTTARNYEAKYAGEGMTLRDYFAAKAMQGICAHPETWGRPNNGIAESAYQVADAMLKARES